MNKPLYFVGEPAIDPGPARERYHAPYSQLNACVRVLREPLARDGVTAKLRLEYLSIVRALRCMDLDFRIIVSHDDIIDAEVLKTCAGDLCCKFAGFPPTFFGPSVAYPRDFATIFPGCILLNPTAAPVTESKNGCKLIESPLGEGGMVLQSGNVAIICDRICGNENGKLSRPVTKEDAIPITEAGLLVGFFPAPVMAFIANNDVTKRFAFNDHTDRVACLFADKNGFIHLIVDHDIVTIRITDEATRRWEPVFPEETLEILTARCKPLGVTVHRSPPCDVPYALNLFQVPDGRILMTNGVPELESLVSSLAGPNKVVVTDVPINYFPVWKYAGIRCLVAEAPEVLLLKR